MAARKNSTLNAELMKKNVVDGILEKLGIQEKSQDCFRVGKYDADKKRNILVTF